MVAACVLVSCVPKACVLVSCVPKNRLVLAALMVHVPKPPVFCALSSSTTKVPAVSSFIQAACMLGGVP
jgi:hypothetical protein